ncbi:radical SAM protein [Nostoc sp. MG11]|uniref:radical SAM protein n=1 Tax=Nostoc sp. MG11 TaxID=2721166 RepID=UPI0018688F9D|nr:radical SAM protein [Nostoc sp. MG11]
MSKNNSVLGAKRRSLWQLALQGVLDGGPSTCQFAITSVCNARCGFCNFAVDRMPMDERHSVTLEQAKQAAEILYRNGVYFLIYVGGEPMAHPHLNEMIAHASSIGMAPMLVTNGSLLTPKRIDELADAGLMSVIISIDAAEVEKHEQNRGLKGVCDRIRDANIHFQRRHISTTASVTMSRLIDDYQQLPPFLKSLGFDSVTFSYPLTTLASSYLGYAESNLVDYTTEELHERFNTLKALKQDFPVVNPTASIEDMQRHLRGEPEQFGCLGGWKLFYLDWHLNLYRCHNWDKPMCHITEFDSSQRVRDGCTACMIDCYRDSSVMQHIGVSVSDGVQAAAKGKFKQAWKHWFNHNNLVSLKAVWEQATWLRRL